jgi:hypothetical protein
MTEEIFNKLRNLNLSGDTQVELTFEEREDVFHYTEDYHDEVLSDTGIIGSIASLLCEFRDSVTTTYGDAVLQDMRDSNLLDEYERDGTFDDYLTETLFENHWDLELIEWSTEKYDHKRGCCTVSANFSVPLSRVLQASPASLSGWEASVKTDMGTLVLG